MMTLRKRALLALGLTAALLGSTVVTASTGPAVAATATPTVQITLHNNWAGMYKVAPDLRYQFTQYAHYTLYVKGENFVPSATARMALIDTPTMKVVWQGQTSVQPEYVFSPVLRSVVLNPNRGTFEYVADVHVSTLSMTPHLWCQAATHADFHEVSMD